MEAARRAPAPRGQAARAARIIFEWMGHQPRSGALAIAISGAPRFIAWAAVVAVVWLAREVLMLAFIAVLVAVVFSFPVRWLSRLVPRGLAVILVLTCLGGLTTGMGLAAGPQLRDQLAEARESAPRALRQARRWLDRLQPDPPRASRGRDSMGARAGDDLAEKAAQQAGPAVIAVVGGVTAIVLVVVLAAFLVHEPDLYRRGIRRLVPPRWEAAYDELWTRVTDGMRRWVGGILVSMTIMGTLTAAGLLAVGIESWLFLGVLTFFGTFVPYLGAVASAVPGLLVALAQSPRHLLLAAVVYLGVHLVEGYIVEPLVMRRAVQLQPALLLFGQAMFGAVFGLLGVAVATPAIACAQVIVGYLWVERRLRKPEAA